MLSIQGVSGLSRNRFVVRSVRAIEYRQNARTGLILVGVTQVVVLDVEQLLDSPSLVDVERWHGGAPSHGWGKTSGEADHVLVVEVLHDGECSSAECLLVLGVLVLPFPEDTVDHGVVQEKHGLCKCV